MNRKVVIFVLDGATFDVVNPLTEEGWMPNLRRLIENGARRSLRSTIPSVTGAAGLLCYGEKIKINSDAEIRDEPR